MLADPKTAEDRIVHIIVKPSRNKNPNFQGMSSPDVEEKWEMINDAKSRNDWSKIMSSPISSRKNSI